MTGGWISSPVLAQEHPADSIVLSQDTLPKQTLMIDGKPMTEKQMRRYYKQMRKDSIRATKDVWWSVLGGPSYTPEASFGVGGAVLASFRFHKNDTITKRSFIPAGVNLSLNGTIVVAGAGTLFFKENHFLVGLSLDGNKAIHDLYRTGRDGKGSFRRVFATAERFRSSGVDFNILSTVNRDVAADIEGIYAFFKRNGFRYQQYIPCIDPIASERGTMPYSLTAELYGGFLIRLFDLYYRDWSRGDYVSIRYFDNLVSMMAGYRPEQCGLFGFCPKNYVFEADGSAYPCDFYVLDGYRLGNIMEDGFDDFDARSSEIGFSEKSAEADAECRSCSCFPICRGGCRRDREDFSTGQLGRSYLCPAYKSFFAHALPYLRQMGEAEAAARRRG